jgi:hypothetical protein
VTQVDFDNYWPFEAPPRQADMGRWRKMGRLWLHNGVFQNPAGVNYSPPGNGEFAFHTYEPANSRLLVDSGIAFVEGFYGGTGNWTWVSTPGNDGMVKVRLDLTGAQQLQICYENWHGFHDDPFASHGIVETPLFEIWPDGRWADRRLFVSPDVVTGLETIPPWIPQGYRWGSFGPASMVDVGPGGIAAEVNMVWAPANRLMRISGHARASQGDGWVNAWVHLRLLDNGIPVRDNPIIRPLQWYGANTPTLGWSEFVVPNAGGANFSVAVQVVGGLGTVRFDPWSCYIEVDDLGVP